MRADLDALWEIMGTLALLEYSNLSNLILYFPISADYVTHVGMCVTLTPSNKVTARFHLPSRPDLLAQHRSQLTSTANVSR